MHRYRPVAPNSYVDETLFGGASPSKDAKVPKPSSPKTAALAGRSAVTIKADDLERMMKGPATMTAEMIAKAKAVADAKKAAERAAAQAKIETMMRLGEEARKNIPPTETELIKAGKDKAMLSRATFLLDEQRDDVKFMNQKVLYSKCVTVRDAQILEKKHLMQVRQTAAERRGGSWKGRAMHANRAFLRTSALSGASTEQCHV